MEQNSLLIPRYKVIATGKKKGEKPYPSSPFKVGDILIMDGETKESGRYCRSPHFTFENEVREYPNIFEKMHWSERRDYKELPKYLKHVEDGFILKVIHYDIRNNAMFLGKTSYQGIKWYEPSTEEDYFEYLKTKEK